MEHLSKIELIGRVGAVDERIIGNERLVRFSVGVNTMFKNRDGAVASTTWFNCTYWGNIVIKKGQDIHLEGWMVGQTYVDEEGRDRQYLEVKVNRIW